MCVPVGGCHERVTPSGAACKACCGDAQETLQRLERSQTRMGSPRRASRMGLHEGSPSPKRRPRRLDVENIENSLEARADTPTRQALGDVTPGKNAQACSLPCITHHAVHMLHIALCKVFGRPASLDVTCNCSGVTLTSPAPVAPAPY